MDVNPLFRCIHYRAVTHTEWFQLEPKFYPITSSRGHLYDVLLPDWTPTQQLYNMNCWAHGCKSHNPLSSWMQIPQPVELMDGASFSWRLVEDDKGDRHLDAPYYWLCSITRLKQAGYRELACSHWLLSPKFCTDVKSLPKGRANK
jgi:hypothetical protein